MMPDEIIKNGFLGSEYDGYSERIRNKYKDLFELAEEINRFCHTIYISLDGKVHFIHKEIIASTLYIKSMASYQSIIILIKRGLLKDAHIILRTMIENMYWLASISKYDNYYIKYILKDLCEEIKKSEFILENRDLPVNIEVM